MVKRRKKKVQIQFRKILSFIYKKKLFVFVGLGSLFLLMSFAFLMRKETAIKEWKSFDEIKRMAEILDENPKMDNENIIKPDYTTVFGRWRRGILSSVTDLLGFTKNELWQEHDFKPLLERVTKKRLEAGYKDNTIVKMQMQQGTRLFVLGSIQAAFHSLVRDVEELIKMGVMSKELKIVSQQDFLFCTGDAIDRYPYSIETMSLLMRILEENPEQFFYIQGNHEDNSYWKDYTLKDELLVKVSSDGQAIPLEKEINTFFTTLPIAWYGALFPQGAGKFIRISHEGTDFPILKEAGFIAFLQAPIQGKLEKTEVRIQNNLPLGLPTPLVGIVRSEKKRKTYQTMDGIRMLPPEEGVVAWTVLSCPTKIYQKGINFFHDAFIMINVNSPQVSQWTITLYNQDVRVKNGFTQRTHNFISGAVITGNQNQQGAQDAIQQGTTQQQQVVPVQPVQPSQVTASPVQQQQVVQPQEQPQAPQVNQPVAPTQPVVSSPTSPQVQQQGEKAPEVATPVAQSQSPAVPSVPVTQPQKEKAMPVQPAPQQADAPAQNVQPNQSEVAPKSKGTQDEISMVSKAISIPVKPEKENEKEDEKAKTEEEKTEEPVAEKKQEMIVQQEPTPTPIVNEAEAVTETINSPGIMHDAGMVAQ